MKEISAHPRSHFGLSDGTFVFLFVFDFLSYFERKNPLALIRAFRKAFEPDENVQLVLKCSNPSANIKALERLKEGIKGSRVTIIDTFLPRRDLNALFSLCDCYVSLHRAEGFGLPLAEAMGLGKPVLATGYSGNTDFMTVNNSFLIKYRLAEIEEDIGPYRKGSVWADPDVDHAAELMRFVYEHRETGQRIGEAASENIRAQYSPGQIGQRIGERMRVIASLSEQAV
jgi:glycosyltransferase involved in cell wall biosynthesis